MKKIIWFISSILIFGKIILLALPYHQVIMDTTTARATMIHSGEIKVYNSTNIAGGEVRISGIESGEPIYIATNVVSGTPIMALSPQLRIIFPLKYSGNWRNFGYWDLPFIGSYDGYQRLGIMATSLTQDIVIGQPDYGTMWFGGCMSPVIYGRSDGGSPIEFYNADVQINQSKDLILNGGGVRTNSIAPYSGPYIYMNATQTINGSLIINGSFQQNDTKTNTLSPINGDTITVNGGMVFLSTITVLGGGQSYFLGSINCNGNVFANSGLYSQGRNVMAELTNVEQSTGTLITMETYQVISASKTINNSWTMKSLIFGQAYDVGIDTPMALRQMICDSNFDIWISTGTNNAWDWKKVSP